MDRPSAFGTIYFILGLIIAYNRGYLTSIVDIGTLLSAILAVAAWPLLLFGIDLHITA